MVKESASWIKRNVAAVVTWAIILLGGAVAWGSIAATIDQTGSRVEELHTDSRTASSDRAKTTADVMVLQVRQEILSRSMQTVVTAVDRLESVVSRLEAMASRGYAPRP